MRLLEFYNNLSEDARQDVQTLDFARKVADSIQEYMTRNEGDTARPYGLQKEKSPGLVGNIGAIMRATGWSEQIASKFDNLIFAFFKTEDASTLTGSQERAAAGGYGSVGDKRIIVVSFLLDKDPFKYVNTRFSGAKKTFMHEFIHHLDWMRSGGHGAESNIEGEMEEYYSSPHEYNAYFNEVLEELDAWFNRVLPKVIEHGGREQIQSILDDMLGHDFQDFVRNVYNHHLPEDFKLHPKYERKFIRRLYPHYVNIVNDLKERGLMEERILQAAFVDPATSIVYPVGNRHLIQPLMAHGVDIHTMERLVNEPNQGFVTDKGRWIDRRTAARLVNFPEEELDSRDIPGVSKKEFDINEPHNFRLAWSFLDMPKGDKDES